MDCPLIAHGVPVECLWMTAANRYLIDQKLIRRVRTMLIGSFRRKLLRRLLAQMVQAWHELAKFKKVETRTRAQLLEALKAQEALISAAEETLDEYARVLIGTEKSLENEARTQAHLTRIADDAHTELTALRLKSHAAQQEVLRLRTIMRHFEIRYPRATAILRIEVPDAAAMHAAAMPAAHVPMALEPFPPPPLVVDVSEMKATQRLKAATSALASRQLYTPPTEGGSNADAELRRMQALLAFVLDGTLPEKPSADLIEVEQACTISIQRVLAQAEARVLSEDGSAIRQLHTLAELLPNTEPSAPPPPEVVSAIPAASAIGGDRERNLLLGGLEFDSADAESGGPVPRTKVESSAEALARRVAERREEIEQRMTRHRVNLYAIQKEQIVETDEAAEERAAKDPGVTSEFGAALVGF